MLCPQWDGKDSAFPRIENDCQPFTPHLNGAGRKRHSRQKRAESRRGEKGQSPFPSSLTFPPPEAFGAICAPGEKKMGETPPPSANRDKGSAS
ncbi:hypothetical protein DPEC_G00348120 [Dallia pectoralis]|uniref:Uncharacterized protein n=1 Tax=Dallia pectoralis TaxID=75939 RepID=A0ACC2F4A8_DALPE|nr:hypothetical protein DPEC_G00348120 [Dallia pectoralis]